MTTKNDKWIYTYDYAPGSLWEPWREEEGVPAWIAGEACAVAKRVRTDLPRYLLLTDSHFTYNGTWDDTVASLRAVQEQVKASALIHLGDLTDGMLDAATTRQLERKIRSDMESLGIPVHIIAGNHDFNYFKGNPDILYPEKPQFYVDDAKARLRFLFIDSFDPKEQKRYGFSEYGIHWLEAALHLMPADYRAIVFSHVPPLVRLQVWTDEIRNREKLMEVLNKYAGRILACINGHSHCDLLYNDLYNGQFPVIIVNCAKCEYYTDHKPEGARVPFRRLGDRTQECFDILQADTEQGMLFFTRFGAGADRVVKHHKAYWQEEEGAI